MQLKVKRRGAGLCVRLTGELDHHTAKLCAKELDALIEKQRIEELILDLDELTFIDSSGLGMILGRYKKLKEMGAALKFIHVPRACDKLFSMSGVYAIATKIE